MAPPAPLFAAVTSSTRHILLLLKSISFAKKCSVRISADGLRFATEEGSVMEAFIFLEAALFSSYTYRPSSSQNDPPVFDISLPALLETLNIFTLSDPASSKRPGEYYDVFRTHRPSGNPFSTALAFSGVCRLSYESAGSPLRIHMSESGVTTTCDLTTYDNAGSEEIPFRRDALALKTIMRSAYLLDLITELSSLNPARLTIRASPTPSHTANLSLSASGPLGSAAVDFTVATDSDTPILETFHCPERTTASFKFALLKATQPAMAAATKVSLRLDEDGVLSLQFLVEVDGAADKGQGVAFVDFRIVPLVDGEGDGDGADSDETEDE